MSDIKTLIERTKQRRPGLMSKLGNLVKLGLMGYGAHKLGQKFSPEYDEYSKAVIGKGKELGKTIVDPITAKAKQINKQIKQAAKEKLDDNSTATTESTDITQFIKHLGEKDYATADKYLEKVIQSKLQAKIAEQYKSQKLY